MILGLVDRLEDANRAVISPKCLWVAAHLVDPIDAPYHPFICQRGVNVDAQPLAVDINLRVYRPNAPHRDNQCSGEGMLETRRLCWRLGVRTL